MTFYQKRIEQYVKFLKENRSGVALFIVLAAMATLAIFVGEITYTAQINQKLAYDRLDQIKAESLAKSGLRLSLLRIKAYSELKKTIGQLASSAGASAAAVNSVVPKSILEKIWSEPVTIPFSGDISGLPAAARDAVTKFRKDSSMEGLLYISIAAQSSKFNLNTTIPTFASTPAATASPSPGAPVSAPAPGTIPTATPASASAGPTATPVAFDATTARQLLLQQIQDMLQKKFADDEHFRDQYRSLKVEDLVDEIVGWSDLTYDSLRAQQSSIIFKQAPFYHLSELHYLPSVDDDLYDFLAPSFTCGSNSNINVNKIQEPVLRALVPTMTDEEVKAFFDFRDKPPADGTDNSFKTADDFFSYLKTKVATFAGNDTLIQEFKTALTQRGIVLTTDENNFVIHIEATIQQTKKTLEADVSILETAAAANTKPGTTIPGATTPTPSPTPNQNDVTDTPIERSNLKITQLRFL